MLLRSMPNVLSRYLHTHKIPTPSTNNILITAALPYVNNIPHLGNLVGGILSADVYARYCRLMGYNVLFICGTDEYGTATQIKALQSSTTPKQLCDKYHQIHHQVYRWFGVSCDHFGRTTKPIHTQITQNIYQLLDHNHKFEERVTEQFYCDGCKLYLADRYVSGTCAHCTYSNARGDQCDGCSNIIANPIKQLTNPKCSICNHTPHPKSTTNLFLKIQTMQKQLNTWLIENDAMKQWTNNSKGITKAWLKQLQNRCITRDLKWGVKVPKEGYDNKVFYVWFDAPIGYISMTADLLGDDYKKWWLEKENNVQLVQFMGKDNTAFHSIIFPSMLMGTGLPFILPTKLSVTEYLNYQNQKFSKSRGVGIFGNDCSQTTIPVQVWRYYLIANRPENYDSQFQWQDLANRNNKQLVNTIGNLYNRVLAYCYKKMKGIIPHIKQSQISQQQHQIINQLQQQLQKYIKTMEKINLRQGLNIVLQTAQILNKYLQISQFWTANNRNNKKDVLVIGFMIRALHLLALMMEPFMPSIVQKIYKIILIPNQKNLNIIKNNFKNLFFQELNVNKIQQPTILFKQITQDQWKLWKDKYSNAKQ